MVVPSSRSAAVAAATHSGRTMRSEQGEGSERGGGVVWEGRVVGEQRRECAWGQRRECAWGAEAGVGLADGGRQQAESVTALSPKIPLTTVASPLVADRHYGHGANTHTDSRHHGRPGTKIPARPRHWWFPLPHRPCIPVGEPYALYST